MVTQVNNTDGPRDTHTAFPVYRKPNVPLLCIYAQSHPQIASWTGWPAIHHVEDSEDALL